MLRLFILAVLALLGLAVSINVTAAEPLRSKVFFIPLGTDPPEKKGDPLNNARAYLKENGIEIPEDGEATYDRDNLTLTVRAPQRVIEEVGKLVLLEGPVNLRVELDLVEFTAPADASLQPATFQHLRDIAGDSWKVVHRTVLDCQSGHRIAGRSTVIGGKTPGSKTSTPPRKSGDATQTKDRAEAELLANESGAVVELEPLVGPPPNFVDLNVAYHYRSPVNAKGGATDFRAATSTSLRLETPVVLQSVTCAVGEGQGKELALVASVYVVNPQERSLQQSGAGKPK